jgi:alkylated DNA repair dioxygenase AlkB
MAKGAERDTMKAQMSLFAGPAEGPDGFRYQAELISDAEEQELLRQVSQLSLEPFEFHGYRGNRRVKAFGYRYDYSRRRAEAATPIPAFLDVLRRKAARFSGRRAGDFAQVLVTHYPSGAGIGWHRDRPEFGDVVGFSLAAPATLRLRHRNDRGWDRISRKLEPRSAYLLTGAVRWDWEHSIREHALPRTSITLRTLSQAENRTPFHI